MSQRLRDLNILDTPVAVIDLETTGLYEGADRVVEIAIVKFSPKTGAEVLLDTLVNPQRRMDATEIHGITDDDVRDAPVFSDVAEGVLDAISGCALASYNIYYDMKFLCHELLRSGMRFKAPHFCLMYMRPMLGLGSRVRLEVACGESGIAFSGGHTAIGDALAACDLYKSYLPPIAAMGARTFGELATKCGKSYKFLDSFDSQLPVLSGAVRSGAACRLKRRGQPLPVVGAGKAAPPTPAVSGYQNALAVYWDALTVVLSDMEISDAELKSIETLKNECGLSVGQIRYLHARLFSAVVAQYSADRLLDDKECAKLKRLRCCLSSLGWAPGD